MTRNYLDYVDDIINSIDEIAEFIIGMRNKLIHEYFGVDLEIVWVVCTEEIPPLKSFFIKLLQTLS